MDPVHAWSCHFLLAPHSLDCQDLRVTQPASHDNPAAYGYTYDHGKSSQFWLLCPADISSSQNTR